MGQYAIIAFILFFFLYIFFAKPWGLSFVCVTCGELRGEFAIIIIWLLHLAKQSTRGLRSVDFVNISPPTQSPSSVPCVLCPPLPIRGTWSGANASMYVQQHPVLWVNEATPKLVCSAPISRVMEKHFKGNLNWFWEVDDKLLEKNYHAAFWGLN